MSAATITPSQLAEESAIAGIVCARSPEQAAELLAALAGAIHPLPLAEVFTGERRKAVSLALAASLRGEASTDAQGLIAWLDSTPWPVALAILSGKQPRPDDHNGESALDHIGGAGVLLTSTTDNIAPPRSTESMRQLGETLRNDARRCQAVALLRKIGDALDGMGSGKCPDNWIGCAIDRLTSTLRGGGSQNLGDHAVALLAGPSDTGRPRASWGLPSLDTLCPMRAGGLYVLAASPGTGKTSLALQSASASGADPAKGHVAIASLEMSGAELAAVMIARAIRATPSAVRDGHLDPEQLRQAQELAERWQATPSVWIDDRGQATAESLGAWARQRHAGGNLALLVVDYLQLLKGTDPRAAEYATITNNTRALKMLAKDLHIPVLCLSQLSRKGREDMRDRQGHITGTPEPRLADLRGSGSIEQDADAVVFIHPTQQPDNKAMTTPVQIIVAKHRSGPCGSIDATFYRRWQLFDDQAAEQPARAEKLRAPPSPAEDHFARMVGFDGRDRAAGDDRE